MNYFIEDPENFRTYNEDVICTRKNRMSVQVCGTFSKRLAIRRELFEKRRRLGDVSLLFAALGLVLMIIEMELYMTSVIDKTSAEAFIIKLTITITTIALLVVLGLYHRVDIKLFIFDNCVDDWHLAIDRNRVLTTGLEFLVCSIHPIPYFLVPSYNAFLALPMFLRMYLLCRSLMLHSRLYEDSSSRSLGALNRVNFNFVFIFRSFMSLHSGCLLIMISLTTFLINSWCLRVCEIQFRPTDVSMLNAMWLIAITFLTVGYGDIVPRTYCGRTISVITGIIGAGCTALVIAILSRKLELTRAEKYVHDLVIDTDLNKQIRNEAAKVLQAGWRIYKANKNKLSRRTVNKQQCKMLRAAYNIKERKSQQVHLSDGTVTLVDVNRGQSNMSVKLDKIWNRQRSIEEHISSIGKAVLGVHEKLDHVLNKRPS